MIQQVIPLKFRRAINILLHQICDAAFWATKATIHVIRFVQKVLGNIHRRIVKIMCAPKTSRLLVINIVQMQAMLKLL